MKTGFGDVIVVLGLPALLALGLQPSPVIAAPVVTKIAAGYGDSLFIMSDGSLWGMGFSGEG